MIKKSFSRPLAVVGLTLAFAVSLAAPATAAPAQFDPPKTFYAAGDYVHISSTPPATASGHGWWERGESDAAEADVTVQLQVLNNGNWVDVGAPGTERVRPGGGSANRATARYGCVGNLNVHWRSVITADLVGYDDSNPQLVTPERLLACGA